MNRKNTQGGSPPGSTRKFSFDGGTWREMARRSQQSVTFASYLTALCGKMQGRSAPTGTWLIQRR
jgi:hypothetical protein